MKSRNDLPRATSPFPAVRGTVCVCVCLCVLYAIKTKKSVFFFFFFRQFYSIATTIGIIKKNKRNPRIAAAVVTYDTIAAAAV